VQRQEEAQQTQLSKVLSFCFFSLAMDLESMILETAFACSCDALLLSFAMIQKILTTKEWWARRKGIG
jgi:hypothetical protein